MTSRNLRSSILTADLVWGMLAMPLAYLMRYGWVWGGPADRTALTFVPALMVALLFWSLMSSWVRLDGFRAGWTFPAVVSQLLLAVSALMLALFAMGYLVRQFLSRLALGYFGLLLFLGFLAIRVIARSILGGRYTQALVRNVVIVGNGQLAREMTTKIESHPEMLRKVVGFLSPGEDSLQIVPSANRRGAINLRTPDIVEVLKSQGVDEVILTVSAPGHPEVVDLTSRCSREGIAVSMVPQPYELYLTKPELSDLDGIPLLQLLATPLLDREPWWKRGFDVVMTLVLLPVCTPPMVFGATFLKLKKGRAFRSEQRCGKFGEEFLMFRLDSPRRANKLPADEALLRKLSITELPQLFNVLRGDMSLVGPRPEGLDRARHYTEWHRQRLKVKPGITGLAQVHGLRDQHSSEDKTPYDLQYILRRSLFQDISLLLQTGWTILVRLVRTSGPESTGHETTADKVDATFPENLAHAHSTQSSAD